MARHYVLYEDSRAAGPGGKKFPLHELIVALVADRRPNVHRWSLSASFEPIPKSGIDNLLSALQNDVPDLAGAGGRVFAVVDGDRVTEHVRRRGIAVANAAPPEEAVATFIAGLSHAALIQVVVLHDNLESVLRAYEKPCAPLHALTPTLLKEAIAHKDRIARDRMLVEAARNSELRKCLETAVPSLATIADALAAVA